MIETYAARPPRRWPIALPLAVVVLLAVGWSGFWYYAAGRAQAELATWRERQAAAGRVVSCSTQQIGGFPFRFELRCGAPAVSLRKARLSLQAKDLHAAVQVYQPTLMIAEIGGPLTVAGEGQPAVAVDWTLAQASVHGLPSAPDRAALVLDKPTVARLAGGDMIASADHAELHARQAPRLPQDPPALDLAINVTQALVPGVPRVPAVPIDAEINGTLHGLTHFDPRPWPTLLRDMQAANGRLDVTQVRIRQGDILGVGHGTLSLTARGTLEGELALTIAGIEQLVTALGVDKAVGQASQRALERYAPGVNLDRLLGSHGNAALAAAGASLLGQPTELEGRHAVTLPLRISDGVVFLGPMRVGEVAPLF
jgi:hypothetical protein